MLFGGFAPPAARQTSAVFFIVIAPTEILHFYLELAVDGKEKFGKRLSQNSYLNIMPDI